jgi:putative lipoic acid-binding regulatory protein
MADRQASLEVLRQVHQFPGPYIFKVIGENTPHFVARVVQVAVVVLGPTTVPDVSIRHSSGGKHQSITLTVHVTDAERVLDIYDLLTHVTGVRFLL